jgi:hypothetical protein
MEVYVLLKGYDYEGFGSNVEVFDSREKDGVVQYGGVNDIQYDYDYDLLKIVKKVVG